MGYPRVINIQRFSVHDGPGIRTSVFFKGCPLRCAWCHNPESQSFEPELMFDPGKCTGCGFCVRACTQSAIHVDETTHKAVTDPARCETCGDCADFCPQEARELVGSQTYAPEELVRLALADRSFYERSGGGVTLSGGEVLAQDPDYVARVCELLHAEGIHLAIDTSGFAPRERLERLLPHADLWLYDLKLANPEAHAHWCGQDNAPILDNLAFLLGSGANVNVRIPTIGGVNADDASMLATISWLKRHQGLVPVSLLPYHTTGSSKYARLGRDYDESGAFHVPSDDQMDHLRDLFHENGFADVRIGG